MIRAGVFIGVDQTGNLQRLNDAAAGAKRMHEWAIRQGLADHTNARLITDLNGQKVYPDLIYDAIKEIIDGPGVDQLIIYFAGHGVNINRNEHWLLTDAPVRTSAAVDVSVSVDAARYCGIGHVVIISDACRVAPDGIQAQSVRGVDIFPNYGAGNPAKPVDQFFACLLGRTAVEIKDPAQAAGTFSALYTNAFLDALNGERPELLEPSSEPGDAAQYVKPVRLEAYLESEIPRRVLALNLQNKVNQNPDAILTAHSNWISRVSKPSFAVRQPVPTTPPGLRSVTDTLVRIAIDRGSEPLSDEISLIKSNETTNEPGVDRLAESFEKIVAPFGTDHFESQCGVKVRGARIMGFRVRGGSGVLFEDQRTLRVNPSDNRVVPVLLKFERDVGTLIPAIPGFVVALTLDDDELVDVTYEPSSNNWRWSEYVSKASDLRALRAIAATASQHSRFRLDRQDGLQVARKMQLAKGVDPTLAVYAAYAYHDLQEIERIKAMSGFLRDDLGFTFFDLALLGRELVGKSIRPDSGIEPFLPLFSQGWALLSAHRVRLPSKLEGIERTLQDSLWSLYNLEGLAKLDLAMQSDEVWK